MSTIEEKHGFACKEIQKIIYWLLTGIFSFYVNLWCAMMKVNFRGVEIPEKNSKMAGCSRKENRGIMAEIILMDTHTWRFEDDFVRFFLLEGEEQAVLLDSGVNCPDGLALAKGLTDKPILLLNTHGDADHTSGTAAFSEIHMHRADYEVCGLKEKYPDTVLAEVRDGDVIELGNRPLEILHIPWHTVGSIAVLDVDNRALYAGDSVQKGHIYMFGGHRAPNRFETSLNRLIARRKDYDRIYASHDVYELPGDYAERVKQDWKQVQSGTLPYEMVNLFGNEVRSYTGENCGFLMEK